MSRSKKKHPSFRACRVRSITLRAQKKAERRAVNSLLGKGEWENLPLRREVGPSSCCRKRALLSYDDFSWELETHRDLLDKSQEESVYIVRYIHPYYTFPDADPIDKSLTCGYHEDVQYDLRFWFPIFISFHPFDIKKVDEDYLYNFYKRK